MKHVTSVTKTRRPAMAASLLAKAHGLSNILTGVDAVIGVVAVGQGLAAIWQEVLDALNNADTHDNN